MENPHVCFDRILPKDMFKPKNMVIVNVPGAGGAEPTRLALEKKKLWVNGSTLRVKFLEGTPNQKNLVKQFATEWSNFANIKFNFNDANDAEIRIKFDSNDGAWSYIGTDCRNIPLNSPTMNLGWIDKAVVLHEFGHALGMIHEHQNPQGGIKWNKPIVYAELGGSPNFWDKATVDHNMFETYNMNQINGTAVDKKSIMLYAIPKRWTTDGFASVENKELSEVDKSFIGNEKNYPKNVAVAAIEIPISRINATTANIGVAGEEDLFSFTVVKEGRYNIQTIGSLDVAIKLFGPNSQTQLIAEDDDSGPRKNAKIIASLIPGHYFIQVRHHDSQNGVGTYKIFVSKKKF
jgi:Astacin (Peptidase family M12A)